MPSYLWLMTSPPPVLARYGLVMSGPCVCFISMYIQNLPATHVFIVVWRLVYTFCRPSLVSYGMSYFLASHSLKPAPFEVGLLLGRGLFLLQPTLLLFSAIFAFPAIPPCYSCCGVIWPKPVGPLWACCLFFPQWLSIVIWTFWLRCLQAPVSHLPFGHPWPIYFLWAFLALSLTLYSHRLLLTPLYFLGPITLSFILRSHGLAINPLLSLLALLRACCGPFSFFYITYCPWVCHFSLSELL